MKGVSQNVDTANSRTFSSPLPASVLNIDNKFRTNLFPWRGQFSPQLVETLLCAYAPPRAVVLDPFMGSGTVLIESVRQGLPAHGYEINPAAYLLARVYELCSLTRVERRELLDIAETVLIQARPAAFELPLFSRTVGEPVQATELLVRVKEATDVHLRIVLEALIVLLDQSRENDEAYRRKWIDMRKIVLDLPYSANPVRAWFGDARQIHLPEGSVDFVLSSPPYINVFNYHQNSRSAIEALGWKPLVVARSEIGSNRKFRQNRFLTVVQYCIDMALALAEIRRICTKNARILLILGRESNVHKTAFYNGQIIERLATAVVGFRLDLKQERVFLNRFGQNIYEDLLHLSPQADGIYDEDTIVKCARHVGRDVLSAALDRVPRNRAHYLRDAIERAEQVEMSPILKPAAAVGGAL